MQAQIANKVKKHRTVIRRTTMFEYRWSIIIIAPLKSTNERKRCGPTLQRK